MTAPGRASELDLAVLLLVEERLTSKLAVMLDNLDEHQPDVGITLRQLRTLDRVIASIEASKYPTRIRPHHSYRPNTRQTRASTSAVA